jgi:nicotinamidase-related amidase
MSNRIRRSHTGLIIVDLQAMLLPAIWEKDRVLRQSITLARGAQALGLPVAVTEQYPKGLGPTVPEVATAISNFSPIEKLTFSSLTPEVRDWLDQHAIHDVILCGIETHVCVTQTALELLDLGKRVFIAVDACSSRTSENWQLGRERMAAAGAMPASVEMLLFELLERAGTTEFKDILKLVK